MSIQPIIQQTNGPLSQHMDPANEHEYETQYKADSNDMWHWIVFMLISVVRLLSAFSVMALLDAKQSIVKLSSY